MKPTVARRIAVRHAKRACLTASFLATTRKTECLTASFLATGGLKFL